MALLIGSTVSKEYNTCLPTFGANDTSCTGSVILISVQTFLHSLKTTIINLCDTYQHNENHWNHQIWKEGRTENSVRK